ASKSPRVSCTGRAGKGYRRKLPTNSRQAPQHGLTDAHRHLQVRHRVKLSMVESVTPLIVTDPIASTLISGTSGRTNRSTKTRVPLGTIVHPNDAASGSAEGSWVPCLSKSARCLVIV